MGPLLTNALRYALMALFVTQLTLLALLFSVSQRHTSTPLVLPDPTQAGSEQSRALRPPFTAATRYAHRSAHDSGVFIVNAERQVINRIDAPTLRSITGLERLANGLAACVIGCALLALFVRPAGRYALLACALIASLHFLLGIGSNFSWTRSHPFDGNVQLLDIALCLLIYGRIRKGLKVNAGSRNALMVYASQSGSAQALAKSFYTASQRAFDLLCVSAMTPQHLARYDTVLLIVSTYGNGEPPDKALGFVQGLRRTRTLSHSPAFSILALGDRQYPDFCAFGHQLHALLSQTGGRAITPATEVDKLDPHAIRTWWQTIATHCGWHAAPAQDPYIATQVLGNRCLNPGKPDRPAHGVTLDATGHRFQPGDVLRILPRLSETASIDDDTTALHPRLYSIASAPHEHCLRLLVRQRYRDDGSPGRVSQLLCQSSEDTCFRTAVQSNPDFHLPERDLPLIMIAAGTGLAPFIGFLAALAQRDSQAQHWLFFGEQDSAHDFYFQGDIEAYQSTQLLGRVETAWSQHAQGSYIPDILIQHREAIVKRVTTDGAYLYICGAHHGFGETTLALLSDFFGESHWRALREQGRVRTDLY